MKPSEILREAARRVESGLNGYCCDAINQIVRCRGIADTDKEALLSHTYFKMVGPEVISFSWFGEPYEKGPHNRRVVALCLAAAIAESENQ
jgi:hypothetical protein